MTITPVFSFNLGYVLGLFPVFMHIGIYWVPKAAMCVSAQGMFDMCLNLIKPTNMIYIKGSKPMMMTIFMCLGTLNLFGTVPYSVSMTSHLMSTLSLGLPIWLTLITIAFFINFKNSMAHFLPANTPPMIASFLLLVETLSSLIRPLTLAFRLAANISAGHVILGMMSSGACYLMFKYKTIAWAPMVISTFYSLFELAICMVQAFVFILLVCMYSNDYISDKSN